MWQVTVKLSWTGNNGGRTLLISSSNHLEEALKQFGMPMVRAVTRRLKEGYYKQTPLRGRFTVEVQEHPSSLFSENEQPLTT